MTTAQQIQNASTVEVSGHPARRNSIKKPKALSTQLFERRRCDEMRQHIVAVMNIASRKGRIAKGVPLFTEEEKATLFKQGRK